MTPPSSPSTRAQGLADLAIARADLLATLIGKDEATLGTMPVVDGWTAKDVLAHIAIWDRWELTTMRAWLAGQTPDLEPTQNLDAFNAASLAPWRDRSLVDVLVELSDARQELTDWLGALTDADYTRSRPIGTDDWAFSNRVEVQRDHDLEHTNDLLKAA